MTEFERIKQLLTDLNIPFVTDEKLNTTEYCIKKDENGNEIKDENGFYESEIIPIIHMKITNRTRSLLSYTNKFDLMCDPKFPQHRLVFSKETGELLYTNPLPPGDVM